MNSTRLEAFSDGVIAIIITIMVLELKVPHGETVDALEPLIPNFLSYVLSFIYVGIYWNNHHHMLYTVEEVSGRILWANLHLLFWLSLFPITTAWIGENHLAATPSALYGAVLLMASLAPAGPRTLPAGGADVVHSGPPHRERAGSQIDLTGELSRPSRRRGRVETWHTDPGLCDASFLRGDNRLEYGT
jgi:hypothetical protein